MPSPKISITNIAGFTIVELLVTMGIFTFLASLGLFVSTDFYRSYAFRSDTNAMVSALDRARSRAMDNVNGAPHGVYVSSTSFTIFEGATYATRVIAADETFALGSGMIPSGATQITFTQLTGEANTNGTLVLDNGIHAASISFNNEGRISW